MIGATVIGATVNRGRYWATLGLGIFLYGCGGSETASTPADVKAEHPAATQSAAVAASGAHPGAEIYQNFCFSCHTPGLSGAPKLGDVEAWGPRIAKGKALLVQATIEGVQPAMPPRGMCFSCSDEDLAAAVDYMIEKSQ